MTLSVCLDQILSWLRRYDRPVIRALRPGISHSRYDDLIARLPVEVPREIHDLYTWRDGTRIAPGELLDDLHFFPGFYFLSLDDSLTTYRAVAADSRWDPAWLPIFANGGGDFYATRCGAGDGTGSVVGFLVGQSEHPIEYESLTAMAATILACYEEGVFFLSKEGYLEADDHAHAAIARRLNPALGFWRRNDRA